MKAKMMTAVQSKNPLNDNEIFLKALSDMRDKAGLFAAATRCNPKVTHSQACEIQHNLEDITKQLYAVSMLILNTTNNVGE